MLKQVSNLVYVEKEKFGEYDAVLVIATELKDADKWQEVPGHKDIAELAKVSYLKRIY
jgi:hypothetical protein